MRKAIFAFIGIILLAVGVNWTHFCTEVKTDKEVFGQNLAYADMYEYKDPDYDFTVRYPSFFEEQPDSLDDYTGHARFSYNDYWVNLVLEGYVMNNHGQSLLAGMDSIGHLLHAVERKQGKDFFILSGPQYENENRIDGYSYYSKFMKNGKLWFVYTMVYPDHYKDVLTRLFREIDEWQIWERPRLKLKQGESQTPKAVSK